jgi:hypothetical protein
MGRRFDPDSRWDDMMNGDRDPWGRLAVLRRAEMTDEAVLVMCDGLVRLETADRGFVGWARIPPFARAPDMLIWGERFFRNRGAFMRGPAAAPDDPGNYLLYTEAFIWHLGLEQVVKDRPGLPPAAPVKK